MQPANKTIAKTNNLSCECHEHNGEESTEQATDKGTIQVSQPLMGSRYAMTGRKAHKKKHTQALLTIPECGKAHKRIAGPVSGTIRHKKSQGV